MKKILASVALLAAVAVGLPATAQAAPVGADDNMLQINAAAKGWRKPLDKIKITQDYSANHNGIDFGAPTGTPVKATYAGTVTRISFAPKSGKDKYGIWGLGHYVVIKHTYGKTVVYSVYAHLNAVEAKNTKVNQWIENGVVLGYVGNTGNSEGSHLHFGMYTAANIADGTQINPHKYIG